MTHYVRILHKHIHVTGNMWIDRYFPQYSKDGINWNTYMASREKGGEIDKQGAWNVILSYSARSKNDSTTRWIHQGVVRV